jgi:hypothetical protein
VFVDDVQEGGAPDLAAALGRTHDVSVLDADVRRFAIGAPRKVKEARAA